MSYRMDLRSMYFLRSFVERSAIASARVRITRDRSDVFDRRCGGTLSLILTVSLSLLFSLGTLRIGHSLAFLLRRRLFGSTLFL